jgi:hypothetical protein
MQHNKHNEAKINKYLKMYYMIVTTEINLLNFCKCMEI